MEALARMMTAFDRRRKLLHAGLNRIPGVSCLLAQGRVLPFPQHREIRPQFAGFLRAPARKGEGRRGAGKRLRRGGLPPAQLRHQRRDHRQGRRPPGPVLRNPSLIRMARRLPRFAGENHAGRPPFILVLHRPVASPRFPLNHALQECDPSRRRPDHGRAAGGLQVPDHPVLPFIEGDGTGPGHLARGRAASSTPRSQRPTGGRRRISWFEVYAGEKAFNKFQTWLPDDTLTAFREYLVGIKGPLTTPVGGGIRSLNVALRQELDLFVCLRPVRYFQGMETPVKRPDLVDMVIFRENTEDIYAGIEYAAGTPEAAKLLDFLAREFPQGFAKIRFGSAEKVRAWQRQLEAIGAPASRARDRGRHRHQAGELSRHRAARAQRHRLRHPAEAQERDPGPQGQHHEVHRGRLPRLGLPRGEAVLRGGRD